MTAWERNGLGSEQLMQPTRVRCRMSDRIQELRPKVQVCYRYNLNTKQVVPLLPRCVLGMPLILLVLVVGMSQNTSTGILG